MFITINPGRRENACDIIKFIEFWTSFDCDSHYSISIEFPTSVWCFSECKQALVLVNWIRLNVLEPRTCNAVETDQHSEKQKM